MRSDHLAKHQKRHQNKKIILINSSIRVYFILTSHTKHVIDKYVVYYIDF